VGHRSDTHDDSRSKADDAENPEKVVPACGRRDIICPLHADTGMGSSSFIHAPFATTTWTPKDKDTCRVTVGSRLTILFY
jgi:hypothetical protein